MDGAPDREPKIDGLARIFHTQQTEADSRGHSVAKLRSISSQYPGEFSRKKAQMTQKKTQSQKFTVKKRLTPKSRSPESSA
jgi:hypothetical protein